MHRWYQAQASTQIRKGMHCICIQTFAFALKHFETGQKRLHAEQIQPAIRKPVKVQSNSPSGKWIATRFKRITRMVSVELGNKFTYICILTRLMATSALGVEESWPLCCWLDSSLRSLSQLEWRRPTYTVAYEPAPSCRDCTSSSSAGFPAHTWDGWMQNREHVP